MSSRWEGTPEEVRRRLVRDQRERLAWRESEFWLELPYREAWFAQRLEANHGVWRVEAWEVCMGNTAGNKIRG